MSEVQRMSLDTLTELVERFLPVQQWGFIENVRVNEKQPFVIYNSEWCRIRFFLERERYDEYLHISYGRLHAQNDGWQMKWNGKDCRCWYDYGDLPLIFSFLDGVSPQNAYKENVSWKYEKRDPKWHPLIQIHLDAGKQNNESYSNELSFERYLKFHSSVWSHYGLRFFELFDLRRLDLWEKYVNFLRGVYEPDDYERYFPSGKLPEYQVC